MNKNNQELKEDKGKESDKATVVTSSAPTPYHTIGELAKELGVTRQCIRKWIMSKKIKAVQFIPRGYFRIPDDQYQELIRRFKLEIKKEQEMKQEQTGTQIQTQVQVQKQEQKQKEKKTEIEVKTKEKEKEKEKEQKPRSWWDIEI